jgi:hypothetical protein
MYGLVHNSFKNMVLNNHGSEVWSRVSERDGLELEPFHILKQYEDHELFSMAIKTSEITGTELSTVLKNFGKHFILRTAKENYKATMRFHGATALELLSNLNAMHTRLKSTFLIYSPPRFFVSFESENTYILQYESTRSGLEAFVEGLIIGIGELYEENIEITLIDNDVTSKGQISKFRLFWSKG